MTRACPTVSHYFLYECKVKIFLFIKFFELNMSLYRIQMIKCCQYFTNIFIKIFFFYYFIYLTYILFLTLSKVLLLPQPFIIKKASL